MQTTSSLEIICIFPLWNLFANQTSVTMRRPFCTTPSRGCSRIESVEHNFRCLLLLAGSWHCSIIHQTECLVSLWNDKSIVKKITTKSTMQRDTIQHWVVDTVYDVHLEYIFLWLFWILIIFTKCATFHIILWNYKYMYRNNNWYKNASRFKLTCIYKFSFINFYYIYN